MSAPPTACSITRSMKACGPGFRTPRCSQRRRPASRRAGYCPCARATPITPSISPVISACAADGNYTFYLNDDAGAVFRLHDATVIDDDFTHTNGEVSGSIRLQAGLHPFHLTYRHGTGTNALSLKYSGPASPNNPSRHFRFMLACSNCSVNPIASDDTAVTTASTAGHDQCAGQRHRRRAASAAFDCRSHAAAGRAAAAIVGGQIQYTPNAGFLGEDTFTYTISDGAAQDTATVRVQVCFTRRELLVSV